jgi:hypothetical protein
MSLDVYLHIKNKKDNIVKIRQAIYIREEGSLRELSREEWDRRFPDKEPTTVTVQDNGEQVYTANITHNLNLMAKEAELYKVLWCPEKLNIKYANELLTPLTEGLYKLKKDPKKFKQLNPKNGWGTYESLIEFVENYIKACYKYPNAIVSVWR